MLVNPRVGRGMRVAQSWLVERQAINQGHKILVVAQTTTLASTLVTWLGDAHHELVLATTFAAAKLQLTAHPDLLITEVKLGEHNGLHLALRSRAAGIPAIVLGPPDDVFEHEAEQLGATYLPSADLDSKELSSLIGKLVDDGHQSDTSSLPWRDDADDAESFAGRPVLFH